MELFGGLGIELFSGIFRDGPMHGKTMELLVILKKARFVERINRLRLGVRYSQCDFLGKRIRFGPEDGKGLQGSAFFFAV